MNILKIANAISLIPFIIVVTLPINIISNKLIYNEYKNIKFFIGFLFVSFTIELLKKFPYPECLFSYTMRPIDACDCDSLNIGGKLEINTPGCPSGHMGSISYFAFYNILYLLNSNKNIKFINLQIFLYIILILSMAWARITKKCHNLTQVVLGTIYGVLLAYIFYKVEY